MKSRLKTTYINILFENRKHEVTWMGTKPIETFTVRFAQIRERITSGEAVSE